MVFGAINGTGYSHIMPPPKLNANYHTMPKIKGIPFYGAFKVMLDKRERERDKERASILP